MLSLFFKIVSVSAQPGPMIFFSDSLSLSEDSYFLYNLIGLRLSGQSAVLTLDPPAGWRLTGKQRFEWPAAADSVQLASVTLVRQPGASANFEPVRLRIEINPLQGQGWVVDTFFYIRAPAFHSFSVSAPQPVLEVPENTKKVSFPLLIKNKGTTHGQYRILLKGIFFDEPLLFRLRLRPGSDSLLLCSFDVPAGTLKGMQKILVSTSDSTGMIQSLPISVVSPRFGGKEHATPFADFPAELEIGLLRTDKQYNYYGAAKALWELKKGSLDLSFRSKLYGLLNTLERNVFTIQLKRERWDVMAGQLNSIQHFFSYGRGIHAVYRLSSAHQVGMQAIFPMVPTAFTNRNFSVWLERRGKEIATLFRAVANRDSKKGLHEYLLFHEIAWQYNTQTQFKFNLAIGWEHFLRIRVPTSGALALGGGYSWQRTTKKFEWTSSWQRYPSYFPGVDKGLYNQLHQIRWLRKQGYWDVFYSYNSIVSSLLTDTLYLTDAFRFNTEKSGVRAGYRKGSLDLSFSTGALRQTGVSVAQLPRYQFGEFFFSTAAHSGHFVSFKSLLGFADNSSIDRPVFITSSTFTYRYKSSGIRTFYLQQPVLKDSAVKVVLRINQTLSISPYVGFKVWKRVAMNLRYSLTRTRFDNRINSSAGMTASWQQPALGWQVSFSGTYPFSRSQAPGLLGVSVPFFSLSVKKTLRMPLPLKRRYHQLKVTTYADLNGNRRFDSVDYPLSSVNVAIGKENFMTGKDGSFTWKNIDTGQYKLSLGAVAAVRGLLPPETEDMQVHVQRSRQLLLPFVKSCVVSGRISISLDEYSTFKMVPDNILVKAIDSTGREYAGLTNDRGDYFINVPAGIYTVTLNPEAFTGSIRPVSLFHSVDLRDSPEATVNFVLQERKRPMRLLKQ